MDYYRGWDWDLYETNSATMTNYTANTTGKTLSNWHYLPRELDKGTYNENYYVITEGIQETYTQIKVKHIQGNKKEIDEILKLLDLQHIGQIGYAGGTDGRGSFDTIVLIHPKALNLKTEDLIEEMVKVCNQLEIIEKGS